MGKRHKEFNMAFPPIPTKKLLLVFIQLTAVAPTVQQAVALLAQPTMGSAMTPIRAEAMAFTTLVEVYQKAIAQALIEALQAAAAKVAQAVAASNMASAMETQCQNRAILVAAVALVAATHRHQVAQAQFALLRPAQEEVAAQARFVLALSQR